MGIITDDRTSAPTNEDLYNRQMAMLRVFLEKGAITQSQYDKSAGDLSRLTGHTPAPDTDGGTGTNSGNIY